MISSLQVDGGYYSDTSLQCQAFQICVADSVGQLTKYSFLCPNGSLFDQQYFVCDYWFNVDCSQAESLYSLNEEIDAERKSNIGATAAPSSLGGGGRGGQGGSGGNSFGGRGTNSGNRGGGNRVQTGYGAPRSTRDLNSAEEYFDDLETANESKSASDEEMGEAEAAFY